MLQFKVGHVVDNDSAVKLKAWLFKENICSDLRKNFSRVLTAMSISVNDVNWNRSPSPPPDPFFSTAFYSDT